MVDCLDRANKIDPNYATTILPHLSSKSLSDKCERLINYDKRNLEFNLEAASAKYSFSRVISITVW